MSVPDVLVVGGGPAGSTVAGLLALRGRRVALLDRARFPRGKACGECINPGGVAALNRLGLAEAVEALEPVPLSGWDVVTGGGAMASGFFGPVVGGGLAVSRGPLDAALLRVARERGVSVEEGVRVTGVDEARGTALPVVRAVAADGTAVRRSARVVVGADGLRSVTARSLGAPSRPDRTGKLSLTLHVRGDGPPRSRGRLVLTASGTLGLAPVGPSLWNATVVVGARDAGRNVASDPAGFALSFLERHVPEWDAPPVVVEGPWGSGNFDFRVARSVGDGVLLVGDAAGYYDPLTGQGIYRALRSAELAAPVIDQALERRRVTERHLSPYARELRRAFAPGRRVQRLVEAVVSGPLREPLVRGLATAPPSLDALIRVTGDARPARTLLRPSVWGALLDPRRRGRASPRPVGHRVPGPHPTRPPSSHPEGPCER